MDFPLTGVDGFELVVGDPDVTVAVSVWVAVTVTGAAAGVGLSDDVGGVALLLVAGGGAAGLDDTGVGATGAALTGAALTGAPLTGAADTGAADTGAAEAAEAGAADTGTAAATDDAAGEEADEEPATAPAEPCPEVVELQAVSRVRAMAAGITRPARMRSRAKLCREDEVVTGVGLSGGIGAEVDFL